MAIVLDMYFADLVVLQILQEKIGDSREREPFFEGKFFGVADRQLVPTQLCEALKPSSRCEFAYERRFPQAFRSELGIISPNDFFVWRIKVDPIPAFFGNQNESEACSFVLVATR